MQLEPIVKSLPVHHRHRTQHSHSNSISFNLFHSAVSNVASHHSHQLVPPNKAGKSDEFSMSGHQHQMGRLRKFTGASLLSRFRSGSKTTSEEDETPAARAAVTNVDSGHSQQTLHSANVSDPVTGCTISSSDDVADHSCASARREESNCNDAAACVKMEKLINGIDAERESKRLSANATDCDERQNSQEAAHQSDEIVRGTISDQISPHQASAPSPKRPSSLPPCNDDSDTDGVRVYKKVSTNGKLVLYLLNRDLIITKDTITPLHAVITVDAEEVRNKKIFAQILLTFRYGRDDEEVMGLKLSNESVLCVEQVYPLLPGVPAPQPLTKCQEVLMKRLGPNAHLVNLKLNHTVPASVRLLPAKEYRGAAIGINYDLRIYTAESIEEKPQRRSQIRMAIRLVQYAPLDLQQTEAPLLRLDKHFLLREGALKVEVGLDRQWYTQGSPINVCVRIHNRSSRIVKKIQIKAVQHVDVTMFSNGKFKNTIAVSEETDGLPLTTGNTLDRQYGLALMENGGGRHWVALEDRYGRLTATLASTTLKSEPNERHFFAIYISYYVKVRLIVSGVGGDVSTKIPFVLMRDGPEIMPVETENTNDDAIQSAQSPQRQSSLPTYCNNASTLDDVNHTKCVVENAPLLKEKELVDTELHSEPKLLISNQETSLNEIQQNPDRSSSPIEGVE
ncbi:phosrestin-2-like [Daphnia carinata]|uniref:phosrestin-2-like n=1 Tax=Daphnia carinata TaxID=120202 RepID=UPI00258031CC|nr:phosrestin-2-like [Daphnia carinata]